MFIIKQIPYIRKRTRLKYTLWSGVFCRTWCTTFKK